MMNKLILLAGCTLLSLSSISQIDMIWANSFGNTGFDYSRSVANDPNGNTLILGDFEGTVDMDFSSGTTDLVSNGGMDIYLAKYDSDGVLIWAHSWGSYNADAGGEVTTDANGNIYFTGRFNSTVDFDPGAGTEELISTGGSDIFVVKLDENGNFIWAKHVDGPGTDQGLDIVVDNTGNILVTGGYSGTADFDPGTGVFNLTSVAGANSSPFVWKLDSSGDFVWAKSFGGDDWNNFAHGIDVDQSGNVFVAGSVGGTGDLDPGAATQTFNTYGYDDIFILKLDANGDLNWATNIGSTYGESANDIIIDSNDDVLIAGYFRQTVDFDPGAGVNNLTVGTNQDAFVLKLTNAGVFVWANQIGGTSGNASNESISLDVNDNIYISGDYDGTVDFDPGTGTTEKSSIDGSNDGFAAKLTSTGDGEWVYTFGGNGSDVANGISAFDDENIYLTGGFSDTADFNIEGIGDEHISLGSYDSFVSKLGLCNLNNSISISGTSIVANQINASYQWLDCDNSYSAIPGETNASFTPTSDGNYAVQITQGGCADTSTCMAIFGVGLNELEQNEIEVYPNPTTDHLNIKSNSPIIGIQIFNSLGEIVQNEIESNFSIAHLENGIYILKIQTVDNTSLVRIIKQ